MPRAPLAEDELERLDALRLCNVLDTPAEPAFDDLTKLTAQLCDAPVALISLIDAERQWFKSSVGVPMSQTPRDSAFCSYTILGNEPLIVEDALIDPRFSDNPLVTGSPFIRFYAGIPLQTAEGFVLGSLCVIDLKPRSLSTEQFAGLKTLAHQVVLLLDRRRSDRSQSEQMSALKQTRNLVSRLVATVLLLGLALTALLAQCSRDQIQRQAQLQFAHLTERVDREIIRRANQAVYGLRGARGVFAASQTIDQGQFARYVASRDLPTEFPGAIGFGFIDRVSRPGAADGYQVKFVNPIEQNRDLAGFDAGSDLRWREAIERSVKSGTATITGRINLGGNDQDRPAYAYLLPIYKIKSVHETPEDRDKQLLGVLFAPILVQDALMSVGDSAEGRLRVSVFDADRAASWTQIFDSQTSPWADPMFQSDTLVQIGGRTWKCRTASNFKFEAGVDQRSPLIIAVCGSFLSVLLAALVWSIGLGRARAIALANSITAGLNAATMRAEKTARQLNAKSIALAVQRERTELALSSGGVGTWEWNPQTGETHFDDRWWAIIGEQAQTQSPEEWIKRVHPDDLPAAQASLEKHLSGQSPLFESAHRLHHKDGTWRWTRAKGVVVSRDKTGKPSRMVGICEDITRQKDAEEQLRRSATHDRLTGLPNRALLHDRLQHCMARSKRSSNRNFAVLFLDFDRFKLINDSLGHQAGDELLKIIATRLGASLRESDSVVISQSGSMAGRLGGDEFVIILDEIAAPEDATLVADRLLEVFAKPYLIGGHEVISTASIGIVTNNPTYTSADEILSDADTAMYEAKAAGKGRYVVFDVAMRQRVERLIRIEQDLRLALDAGQFFLMYQPIISLQTGEVAGVEALLRWNHPQRGLIPPSEFISIAEETGQILDIGQWVLRQACGQFVQWQKTLGAAAPPTISVNLSRKQLVMTNLPTTIQNILTECGMEPHRLHLEVTETAVMKDASRSAQVLASIKQTGVKLDMDDFGTGHSSLASLHQFPIDVLKVDQSFVKNIERGRDFSALVQAIVQLARNLEIQVVAEGIETSEQALFLGSLECELGQGYLFSRPLMADQVASFVAQPITMQRMLLNNALQSNAA